MANRNQHTNGIVVFGLGRFGRSVATELAERKWEVLGIDRDERVVRNASEALEHVATADSTDLEALHQLGVGQFGSAVVGIANLEVSVLTTFLLVDLEVPNIWAKATSRDHAHILERVGAHHVVQPEHDIGRRVGHLVTGRMLDYVPFEEDFALVKIRAPLELIDRRLGDTGIREKYGVTVVSVKRPGGGFDYASQETVVHKGDVLIVSGKSRAVEAFADLSSH